MRDLAAIAAAYLKIDGMLESARAVFAAQDDPEAVLRLDDKLRINDQAYFILAWGQFETLVDDRCRNVVRKFRSAAAWDHRRAWDMINPDDKRMSGLAFEDRVGLLVDRSAGSGSPWARIMGYYALRNQIAHGSLRSERIDVNSVVEEFYVLDAALAR